MKLGVIILAAGQGTRMKSRLPKVLHPLAGKPLLGHVLDTARSLNPKRIVVVHGHGGEQVREAFAEHPVEWVEQAQQLGTGHAVQQAESLMDGLDKVLILYGDVPLMRRQTLQRLIDTTESDMGLITVELENPTGYGRIIRDTAGNVLQIVEQKDASAEQLRVTEINSGIMLMGANSLVEWLARLSNENTQGEYYLTDVLEMAVHDGVAIHVTQPADALEVAGINDRAQLALMERAYQRLQANHLMQQGVTLHDPARFDLRGRLATGQDVVIDVNVIVEGEVILGDKVSIGANTVLRDVTVGDNVQILENCVIEQASIGPDCRIGPFARLRPGAELLGNAHVGNFVEIKKSTIGQGSKVNHLSYVGDSEIGERVNIGAGTITCNYDGAHKHKTRIGDDAFIGSNTALVAPVSVGDGATIGAGSVITKDPEAHKLTVTRARQLTINGWTRPCKD